MWVLCAIWGDSEYYNIPGQTTLTRSKYRSERDTHIKKLVAQARDLAAKGTVIKEGMQSIAVVEIGRIESRSSSSKRKQPCLEMMLQPSRFTSGESIEEILCFFSLKFACAIVFGNALKTTLEDPLLHLSNGENFKWPKLVETMSSESMFFFSASLIQGLVSYRIPNTELRVTLAFRVQEGGNQFVVGFTPVHKVIDQTLLNDFFNLDPLNTAYNRKWGNARDGEQVVSMWNVMAIAKMSPDPKAVLKVVVRTY